MIKGALGIYLRGMAMGAADVVPGVSGGTIAFITGIYTRLINALTALDMTSIRLLIKFDFSALWKRFDAGFLILLFGGVLTSILSMAHFIDYLLDNHPILIWSIFLGLIFASAVSLIVEKGIYRKDTLTSFCLGVALVLSISLLARTQITPVLPIVFLAGMIAISAMLLPGLSGSFLLLLFGLYEPTLEAVKAFNGLYLMSFAAGALTGLVTFSRLIRWLLTRHHDTTLMFLIGLLFGSLYAVWPWRDMAGDAIWPTSLSEPMIGLALGCMILAALTVLAIEFLARRFSAQKVDVPGVEQRVANKNGAQKET